MADKAAVFIDGGYLDKLVSQEFAGVRIDYEKLTQKLAEKADCMIFRTYFYHCPPYQSNPPTNEEKEKVSKSQKFFVALNRLSRFEIRLGKLARRGTNPDGSPILVQKRVDILIGVDMVQLSATSQIQQAILIAGDSDLTPAVEAVKKNGVLVTLWHSPKRYNNNTVHQELWDACDDRFEIDRAFIDTIRRS